jgi:hypothetical protein
MLTSLALAASLASAQPAPPPPPLPPPPLPAEDAAPAAPATAQAATDPDLEPQVTIVQKGEEKQEIVRIGGDIKFVRVTPRTGRPYYLVPSPGGTFLRRDSLDTGLSVPLWVLFSW